MIDYLCSVTGMQVKSNLAVLMAQHNPPLNQAQVARKAKVSPTTINQLYQNKLERLSRSLCERLYKTYGWKPGDIWVVTDEDPDEPS